MDIQQFAALKPGDEIENAMSHSKGRVTETSDTGVHIAWAGNTVVTFFYSVVGRAWVHWSKIDGT